VRRRAGVAEVTPEQRAGYMLELATRHHLEADGWLVVRSAGSKGPADLIGFRPGETVLVQCKLDGYLRPGERAAFVEFAAVAGAEALVASWFKDGRSARIVKFREA
jgi:Holliday junction resolvase